MITLPLVWQALTMQHDSRMRYCKSAESQTRSDLQQMSSRLDKTRRVARQMHSWRHVSWPQTTKSMLPQDKPAGMTHILNRGCKCRPKDVDGQGTSERGLCQRRSNRLAPFVETRLLQFVYNGISESSREPGAYGAFLGDGNGYSDGPV
jgi:hypothetical protein